MWYADMAGCIFNHFLVESDACGFAGLCYVRDWTCDECSMLMSQLASFMTEEETIAEGVSYLQGILTFNLSLYFNMIFHYFLQEGTQFYHLDS